MSDVNVVLGSDSATVAVPEGPVESRRLGARAWLRTTARSTPRWGRVMTTDKATVRQRQGDDLRLTIVDIVERSRLIHEAGCEPGSHPRA